MKKNFWLVAFLFLFLFSCKKESGTLKEETQKVRINGVNFYLLPFADPAYVREMTQNKDIRSMEDVARYQIVAINKDLNPIVTPNNVLTDCLNGTFLTFNGDELVLQNDSGNTTITGPKDIGNVSLSEGFEPLGVKEYGGILYVVSVRKAYDSLGRRVPSEDEVEFGSYPSPESASYRILPSAGTLNLNNNKNSLYKTFVINKEDFKAGRDVSFTENVGSPNIMNNVWRPSNPNALYNVKLLLSLNSGTIDLTDDI